jgi:hypothetical protein
MRLECYLWTMCLDDCFFCQGHSNTVSSLLACYMAIAYAQAVSLALVFSVMSQFSMALVFLQCHSFVAFFPLYCCDTITVSSSWFSKGLFSFQNFTKFFKILRCMHEALNIDKK